jgi:1-acyl-sn-glycerol-3-phosphate acyltransferase
VKGRIAFPHSDVPQPQQSPEPSRSVESQTISIVRKLLLELGSASALQELERNGHSAHLERELGLGSLERVELMVRLDAAFSVRLPDAVVGESETVRELVAAVIDARSAPATLPRETLQNRADATNYPASTVAAPGALPGSSFDPSTAETLIEILGERARAEPDRVHIHLYEEDKVHPITYGELFARASSVAASLRRRGLEPGRSVAMMLPTSADFFFVFAGIQLAGGVPVPIYPPVRSDRIAEYAARQAGILRNAESQFLVTFREAHAIALLMEPQVPSLREVVPAAKLVDAHGPHLPPESERRPAATFGKRSSLDVAFLQYTSGSTGDPKGVVLTHANLLANIRAIVAGVELTSADVAVSWLPLYHDMGLIGAWFTPLYVGIPLVVMSPLAFLSRPERWLWAVARHRGTLTPAPNFAYELCAKRIKDADIQGLDLSSLRAMLNGAEPVRPETLERFTTRFAPYGLRREMLMPVYGLAENSLAISAPRLGSGYKIDRIDRSVFESEGRAVPVASDSPGLEFVSAGAPLSGVEVRIVDPHGAAVPERVEGQLWFRSASATSGYYKNPQATATLMRPDSFLDSGDRAYLAASEIYITGRAKDVIIKGGRNIYPHEVEEIAGRVPGVRTGCVVAFGLPDAASGTEKLVVAAEVRNALDSARISSDITRAISEAIGVPPDRIELLPPHSIAKTSSGKLRRSDTRRLFMDGKLGKKIQPVWMQVAKLAARGALPRISAWLRKGFARAAELIWGVYALSMIGGLFVGLWACVLVAPSRQAAARLTQAFARWMLGCVGIRVALKGGDLLREINTSGPWIFAPNHSSYLDILVIMAYVPAGAHFVAKSEVAKWPIIGSILVRGGHLAFDRHDPKARLQQAEVVEDALRHGESVVIFPEGTFTEAAGIRPFQLGAFKSAVATGRPVCPVAVRGAREILRDQTYMPSFGRVSIEFGPLILPEPLADAGAAKPGAASATTSLESDWQKIVRLRDATREIIARHADEPLL